MTSRVYFRGSRQQARNLLRRLPDILTGQAPDQLGIARGVFLAVGFAALSDIKNDFVVKSRGGTGEDGVKWQPLSKEYLAYQRRFGPGEKARLKKHAGLGKANRFGGPSNQIGLLTKAQSQRWRLIFARTLERLLLSMSPKDAKARAGQIAWTVIKREGGKTMLEVYGNRQVEINRDTGILLNSLSPGQLSHVGPGAAYTRPSLEGGEEQVFESQANGVIVGTNVAYAAAVNKQRPFLPKEAPDVWEQRWLDVGAQALAAGTKLLLESN